MWLWILRSFLLFQLLFLREEKPNKKLKKNIIRKPNRYCDDDDFDVLWKPSFAHFPADISPRANTRINSLECVQQRSSIV